MQQGSGCACGSALQGPRPISVACIHATTEWLWVWFRIARPRRHLLRSIVGYGSVTLNRQQPSYSYLEGGNNCLVSGVVHLLHSSASPSAHRNWPRSSEILIRPQKGNILFLIHHPHRLPDSSTSQNTIHYYMHRFRTEYCCKSLWKTSRNLGISLYKKLHFAVFLQLCFVNSVPPLIFSHFQDEKQDVFLLWPKCLYYLCSCEIPSDTHACLCSLCSLEPSFVGQTLTRGGESLVKFPSSSCF